MLKIIVMLTPSNEHQNLPSSWTIREALNRELLKYDLNNIKYDTFQEIIVSLLNVYASLMKK